MSSTFKIGNRVRIKGGAHEGLVGTVEQVQEPFDDEKEAVFVSISGALKDEPVIFNDWLFADEVELAA